MVAVDVKPAELLVWASPAGASQDALVEVAAHEFKLASRFCSYAELPDVLAKEHCSVAVVEIGTAPRSGLALIKDVHARHSKLTVLAASADAGVDLIRAALEAGASDLLSLPLVRHEFHKALIRLTQVEAKPVQQRGKVGEVITICGARGGVGVTTLAVNLAARLATGGHGEVALVDLDLQRGDVAAFLNLTPLQSLAALAAARSEMDDMFLRGVLTRHGSGVFVLPAPLQVEEAESVGHPDIDAALRLLRAQFPYTIVDTARTITSATVAGFELSDRVFVLTDLSVPGVRAAHRTFELLSRLNVPDDRLDWIVTQVLHGPVKVPDAVRVMGKAPLLTLPHDAAAGQAMNAGVPLNGTRPSPLTQVIEELVGRVTGKSGGTKAKRPLLQRLFTKGATT